MDPLAISEGWSLGHIEQSMHEVVGAGGAALQVNKDFVGKHRGALHDAARLQLLATWARLATDRQLRFHAANKPAAVLKTLCDYAPGIAALRMCDGVLVGDSQVSRREALVPAIEKMTATDHLQWAQIIKGRTIDFTCVSGSKVQYLRPLFTERNEHAVSGKEDMFIFLSALSEFVAKADAERIPQDFLKACAIFASELMKNTQEHATRDHAGRPYIEHVEGLIISWHEMTSEFYGDDFQGHPRLLDFWQREQVPVREGATTALRCLQLSFFDTGPGFASRAMGKPLSELSLNDEREAMFTSLSKNATTKAETGAGNGIPEVLEALRQVGGLMTIRSGRLRIFKSFEPGDTSDMFQFDEWSNAPLAPAAGAVVSLILPIRR
ncbi:hypothetical protein GO307_04648 [Ralstonia solanacearum]|nr:hypothetical protein [Ralstonia solanacearum]